MYVYIYIYTHTPYALFFFLLKIHQRGVQWKQGVVVYIMLYALLHDATPIHCTPLPLHPPCDEYLMFFLSCAPSGVVYCIVPCRLVLHRIVLCRVVVCCYIYYYY